MPDRHASPSSEVLVRARKVELVIFDVDGVLTNGQLYFDQEGRESKAFHVKDGHGMVMLRLAGIKQAILSARKSGAVDKRMSDLGVDFVIQGRKDKAQAFDELLAQTGFPAEQCAFIGDDLVDLPVLARVGLAVAVSDAHALVRERAHWVTQAPGGRGGARELCELLLIAKGRWETILELHKA